MKKIYEQFKTGMFTIQLVRDLAYNVYIVQVYINDTLAYVDRFAKLLPASTLYDEFTYCATNIVDESALDDAEFHTPLITFSNVDESFRGELYASNSIVSAVSNSFEGLLVNLFEQKMDHDYEFYERIAA